MLLFYVYTISKYECLQHKQSQYLIIHELVL